LHPGVYTYQSEGKFENGFRTLKECLHANQTSFELYNSLATVINQVGCGHTTSIIPLKELKQFQKSRKYLPLTSKIIENKIYISGVLVRSENLFPDLGILSIDGVVSSEFIKTNLNRYASDGRILSRKHQMLEKYFSIDYSRFHYTSETFKIEIGNIDGSKIVSIDGISFGGYISKTSQAKLEDIEFKINDSISTAVITIGHSRSKKVFEDFL
jgi:hypothetical protein